MGRWTYPLAQVPRASFTFFDDAFFRVMLAEIWAANPLLRKYLGTPDNPDLIIYRIRPTRVRFMREWALDYHEVPLTCDGTRGSASQF